MDCRLKCEKPEEIVYTMTISMKAKDWEALRDQLKGAWPAWDLSRNIDDLLAQARKVYWPKNLDDAALIADDRGIP